MIVVYNVGHLAGTLMQSDLQEQLGLSALLKSTLTDVSPRQLGIQTSNLFFTGPTLEPLGYSVKEQSL
jgi:hypothetical protein